MGGRIPAKLLMRSDPARPPPSPPCHRLCTPTALPTQSLTTVAPSWSLTTAWRPRRLRPLWHMRRSPSDLTRLLLLFPNTVRVPKVHLRTIRDAAHCFGFEVRRYLRRLPACDAFDCGFARTTTRSSRTSWSLVGGVIPAELLKPSTPTALFQPPNGSPITGFHPRVTKNHSSASTEATASSSHVDPAR